MRFSSLAAAGALLLCVGASSQEAPESPRGPSDAPPREAPAPMDNERLGALIHRFADSVQGRPGTWQFTYDDRRVIVVTDERADRMRIMVPIAAADELGCDELERIMQANFDAALDARYAIARDTLWSTFIHPLSSLSQHEFHSGLAQTLTAAATYGTTYSSGALVFGGGDSQQQHREYYQSIIDRANAI